MANHNRAPPLPSQSTPAVIQSIEDIIHILSLEIIGHRTDPSEPSTCIRYSCIPDSNQNQNHPECDNSLIMDPGLIRAQSLKVLNKCSGSKSWTTYTKQRLIEPRGKGGVHVAYFVAFRQFDVWLLSSFLFL